MEENFCKECSLSNIKDKKKEKTISDKIKNIESLGEVLELEPLTNPINEESIND